MFRFFRKAGLLTLLLMLTNSVATFAQCAMCRATLENNFSNGEIGAGANINFGILYLFVFPYLLVAVVAYFWYRSTRASRTLKA